MESFIHPQKFQKKIEHPATITTTTISTYLQGTALSPIQEHVKGTLTPLVKVLICLAFGTFQQTWTLPQNKICNFLHCCHLHLVLHFGRYIVLNGSARAWKIPTGQAPAYPQHKMAAAILKHYLNWSGHVTTLFKVLQCQTTSRSPSKQIQRPSIPSFKP